MEPEKVERKQCVRVVLRDWTISGVCSDEGGFSHKRLKQVLGEALASSQYEKALSMGIGCMVRHQGVMQAGAVIIEAAIVVPMLLVVLLLLFDFSLTLSDRITLTEAARHGARVSSGLSLGSGDCLGETADAALEAAGTFLENSGTLNAEDVFRGGNVDTLTLNSNCDPGEEQTVSYIEVATEKVSGRPSVFESLFRARPARFPGTC